MKLTLILFATTIQAQQHDPSWNYIQAEWVESRLKVSSYRTHELLKVYFGKFGLQSVKTAIGGFIVPIPTIRGLSQGYDASANIGIGCDAYHAYRIFGWKPKSKRKRVRRGKWIALVRRGGCPFSQKIRLATRLGAAAVVIIDNHDTHEPIAMNTLGTSIPSTIITKADGAELANMIKQSNSPLIMHKQVGRIKLPNSPPPDEIENDITSVRIVASFNPLIEKQLNGERVHSSNSANKLFLIHIVLFSLLIL